MRARRCFLKLLSRVDPEAHNGFGFEGCLLRPGAFVSRAQLRPSDDYPEIPIILEYSTAPAEIIGARRQSCGLYVLWRWHPGALEWREIGRALAASWEWALDLRPLAIRALAEARGAGGAAEKGADLTQIADSLTVFVDKQLNHLKPADRVYVLGILHDHFAARWSA